jgi:hypothetical protein
MTAVLAEAVEGFSVGLEAVVETMVDTVVETMVDIVVETIVGTTYDEPSQGLCASPPL